MAIAWNTSIDDSEATAGELFGLWIVTLETQNAAASEEAIEIMGSDTLALHDIQVEYNAHEAISGRHATMVDKVHELLCAGDWKVMPT